MNPSSSDTQKCLGQGVHHIAIISHPDIGIPPIQNQERHPGHIKITSLYTVSKGDKKRLRVKRRVLFSVPLFLVLVTGCCLVGGYYEMKTSTLQARFLSRYASQLNYSMANGPSETVIFPDKGPYNYRLGYVQLPFLLQKLKRKGLVVTRQARFSIPLQKFAAMGLHIPYDAKFQTGLELLDSDQKTMYHMANPLRVYDDYYSLPYVVIQSLLFIENRGLLSDEFPKVNPAVDWRRFLKAIVVKGAAYLHIEMPSMGGSTLATQTEKFRHSTNGMTLSVMDKITQMASASVRAYRNGEDTTLFRKQLVLDYVNSVPLSAAPGFGEVNGLGDGLFVWYGTDFDEMNRLLNLWEPVGDELIQQGRVIKQLISMMIAHRRPSYYLFKGRDKLSELCDSYVRLLAKNNILSEAQRDTILNEPLVFRNFNENTAISHIANDKGVNVVRNRLGPLFGNSLYTLDRMDLKVVTTLKSEVQEDVGRYLKKLATPEFAQEMGLIGRHLLKADQVDDLSYSFTLFERTRNGNMVRVQTDTTQLPFDLNEGSKLELGSTAKLRTLATYLQIIGELHRSLSSLSARDKSLIAQQSSDVLTQWVADKLVQNPKLSLVEVLQAAMLREYSANPNKRFFTGGGIHVFENFSKKDNDRVVTVTEALQNSINLPFIRIMDDVVKYSREQQWPGSERLIVNENDPRRKELLDRFIDRESRVYLLRFWKRYKNKNEQQRWRMLLTKKKPRSVRLAILYRHLFPNVGLPVFATFIREQMPGGTLSDKKLAVMFEQYAPGSYNYQDMGYLTKDHPLELWLLDYLKQDGDKSFQDALKKSREVRFEIYSWLIRSKMQKSRNNRIRIELERDAFAEIHNRWKSMGYPFNHLVPSLGTALGSSGDRPAALAELMGIIINDGIRLPTYRFTKISFAKDTPYETIVEPAPAVATQVLHPEISKILKEALGTVVSEGTAKRLHNSFKREDGEIIHIGGKTGTGDNRIVASTSSGVRTSSKALNRTATFVFYLGDNHFGTLTAFVNGRSANAFRFTSALPLQVLKGMLPILAPEICKDEKSQLVMAR